MFKNVKISTQIIIGFLMIILSMVGIGCYSIDYFYKAQSSNRMLNDFNFLMLELVETKNLDEFTKAEESLISIRSKLGADLEAGLAVDELFSISDKLMNLHKEKLEQEQIFTEKYPLEKEKRYEIRDIVYEFNDSTLQRDHGLMIYYSKEALYQYKDKTYVNKWYSYIVQVKDELAALGLKDLSDCDEYYAIAQTMGEIAIRVKEIEIEENSEIGKLLEINGRIQAETDSFTKNMGNFIIIAISTDIAFVFIISILIILFVTRPIRKLMEGIEIINKGNFEHKIEIEGKNEYGQLAAAFNQITAKLKEQSSNREEKNRKL